MSSPPLLDVAALLAPIPGDNPAGSAIPYEIKQQLEDARKQDNPDDYADDDPRRLDLKKADWQGIAHLAEETLRGVSKDLLVAARLTEALVQLRGFGGLHDGLRLLSELVEQCWDRLHPPVEDGDLEIRAAPFYWLDDPIRGARLPNVLKMVPLIVGDEGSYDTVDIRGDGAFMRAMKSEAFEQVVRGASAEHAVKIAGEILQARQQLSKLTSALTEKMGPASPALTGVQAALEECGVLVGEIVLRKRPVSDPESDRVGEEPAPGLAGDDSARAPSSRAEAYRQLSRAAAVLRELEPHSPIPYLVQRAVELGSLPFPELIKALIRDANVLNELNRELGIKAPTPPE